MRKNTVTVTLPKLRNPFHGDLRVLGRKIVKAKKGKGSFRRDKRIEH
jgi:hypothetical protein